MPVVLHFHSTPIERATLVSLLPVIVTLSVLHPERILPESIHVTSIDLPHHVFGLPEAWLAAYSPAHILHYASAQQHKHCLCSTHDPVIMCGAKAIIADIPIAMPLLLQVGETFRVKADCVPYGLFSRRHTQQVGVYLQCSFDGIHANQGSSPVPIGILGTGVLPIDHIDWCVSSPGSCHIAK